MNPRASIPRLLSRSSLLVALLALVSIGCSRNAPNAPAASVAMSQAVSAFGARAQEPNGYFPLRIGNRWHSIAETRAGRIPPDGGPVDELAYFTDIFRFLKGTETIDGTSYVVEQDSTNQQGSSFGPVVNWIRYRQDRSGLYEADVAANIPPVLNEGQFTGSGAGITPESDGGGMMSGLVYGVPENELAAYQEAWAKTAERVATIRSMGRKLALPGGANRPGGVRAGELTRLAYPLHPGQSWIIRSEPDLVFTSQVEANETIDVPAGRFPSSRIRIDNSVLGPNDRVHIWFGRAGILAFRYHVEVPIVDPEGNSHGAFLVEYDETLRDRFTAAP